MSKRHFRANSWLVPSSQKESVFELNSIKQDTAYAVAAAAANAEFAPKNFLVPGWKGEGLISKQALGLKNSLKLLKEDAKIQFKRLYTTNRSLKLSIYNEFLSYAEAHSFHFHEVDNFNTFWEHLNCEESPFQTELNQFIDAYCFRAVAIYLFKARFILSLGLQTGEVISEKSLMNPTSYFQKLFKRGSSKELQCVSLQTNPYSWYRPGLECLDTIKLLSRDLVHIGTTELMKICSQDTSLEREENKLDFRDSDYSHSLSHQEFGQFMNQLMIRFPYWLKGTKPRSGSRLPVNQLEILNTKFCGDQLTSFSLSHWLAQDNNSYTQWSQILSPDFQGDGFKHGEFLKICHELHFLNFLCALAERQNHDPLELICNVIKNKYASSISSSEQMSIFDTQEMGKVLTYNRIVLNLSKLPKNNSHHYLLNKINQQLEQLDQSGYLLVFSNQKLFVPSKSEKIEQLLKVASLDAHFNLENLQGKGEIPNFLYVFSKRQIKSRNPFAMNEVLMGPSFNKSRKDSCISMRWEGELSQFKKFGEFVREFEGLQKTRTLTDTPIYQRDLGDGLAFEFHQDAILEGKLLSATNKDPSQITHPNFFRNLTKACLPLDQFFQIETLQPEQDVQETSAPGLLGIKIKPEERFPFVLIVDHRNHTSIKIEICNTDSYRAKFEQYGYAYFQYFGLLPKKSPLNINIFREFFKTDLGHQVIQLSLLGGFSKTKAKLSSLLVPRFFESVNELPAHVDQTLSFLEMTTDHLLSCHPDDLEQGFELCRQTLLSLSSKHPWQTMSRLSYFKYNIEKCLKDFQASHSGGRLKIDYNNPLVKNPLLKLQTTPILPKNNDVFVEFQGSDPNQIHLEVTRIKNTIEEDGPVLQLLHGDTVVVSLYSEQALLDFIQFIVGNHLNISISSILQNLHVPGIQELNGVLDNFNKLENSLSGVLVQSRMLIANVITQQISNSRLI